MRLAIQLPVASQNVTVRAILYMILSSLGFAAVELIGGYLLESIPLLQLVWGRYAVHLLFMVIVLGPRYKTRLVSTSRPAVQIIRSLTMVAMPVCFILANQQMHHTEVWSIYWTAPLMMLALSTWVLREPAGTVRWFMSLLGLGAMLLIYRPGIGMFGPGLILALGVGLAISLHLMFSRILREDHPLASLFHTALWAFMVFSFVMPFLWQTPTMGDLMAMVFVGIIGMLALLALARSAELMPMAVVATFSYTEGIWRMLIGVLLFNVMPTRSALLGTLIIAGITAFMLWYEMRQPKIQLEP